MHQDLCFVFLTWSWYNTEKTCVSCGVFCHVSFDGQDTIPAYLKEKSWLWPSEEAGRLIQHLVGKTWCQLSPCRCLKGDLFKGFDSKDRFFMESLLNEVFFFVI